jgi:hypothetical protein
MATSAIPNLGISHQIIRTPPIFAGRRRHFRHFRILFPSNPPSGIFGFYSLPIRRAEFSDFIQAKGRLVRPSSSLRSPFIWRYRTQNQSAPIPIGAPRWGGPRRRLLVAWSWCRPSLCPVCLFFRPGFRPRLWLTHYFRANNPHTAARLSKFSQRPRGCPLGCTSTEVDLWQIWRYFCAPQVPPARSQRASLAISAKLTSRWSLASGCARQPSFCHIQATSRRA